MGQWSMFFLAFLIGFGTSALTHRAGSHTKAARVATAIVAEMKQRQRLYRDGPRRLDEAWRGADPPSRANPRSRPSYFTFVLKLGVVMAGFGPVRNCL